MLQTAKHFPNASNEVTPNGTWTPSSQPPGTIQTTIFEQLNNGVGTSQDDQNITTFGDGNYLDLWFDWSGLSTDLIEATRLVLGIRFSGLPIAKNPGVKFQVWTDFPSELSRMIAESAAVSFNTANMKTNGSVIFTGVSVSRDELLNIRVRLFSLVGTAGLPEPYEQPA